MAPARFHLGATLAVALLACACGRKPVEHVVAMRGMAFEPARLTVAAGDRVRFTNEDIVPHTATAPGRFDSGALAPSQSFSVTLSRKGDVAYGCTLHPMMVGAISVR